LPELEGSEGKPDRMDPMPNRDKKVLISAIALGLVALFWGTSFAVIKDIIDSIPPFTLMMLRFGFSTILLSLVFGHRLKRITGPQVRRSGIIGLFLASAFVALILGIRHTTASNQSFLVGACVIFVPFLAWAITRVPPGRHAVLGALLATLGIGLLTLDGSFSMNKGDLLSILCSLSVACHMVAIERLGREVDPIASTIVQFAVTTLCFVALTGLFETYHLALTPRLWKALAYLVIVTTVIAFTIQNMAQRHLSSTSTALILTLETAFGGVFAVLYLREQLTLRMLLGCIVIFAGILTEETQWRFLRKG
jgi:drug/metabolite transporter (DMT)-like permease